MRSFSERKGFIQPPKVIQTEDMSEELRNSLWNVLDEHLWQSTGFLLGNSLVDATMYDFSRRLWADFFKKPVDSRPEHSITTLEAIRKYFFPADWYEVYDLLEWILAWTTSIHHLRHLQDRLNQVMERELAGYRFVDGVCTEITQVEEVEALGQALEDAQFPGVQAHLRSALQMLSDRERPDYRNSIKESISAVESMAKAITGKDRASLGDALVELEQRGAIHTALKRIFSSLYGYASDEGGIRHAMLEEPNLTAADAKFFLLSCTSFINYLKAKI